MATLGNKKSFSGMVGNVVFKSLNGQQVVQSRPTNIRQTTATKKSASEFGSCSQWARQLRNGLSPFLVGLTDSTMHSRFSAAVYNAIKSNTALPRGERTPLNSNMESLHGFEFNTHSPFANNFKPPITAGLTSTKEVAVALPAFDPETEMTFLAGCTTARLAVYMYATNLKDPESTLAFHSLLALDKQTTVPAQNLLTTTPLPDGYFVLVSAKLLYYNANVLTESNYLNTKEFSPAMVLLAEVVG
jgi:hypothetical protein